MKKVTLSALALSLVFVLALSCAPDPVKAYLGEWQSEADPAKGLPAIRLSILEGGMVRLNNGEETLFAKWIYDAKDGFAWLGDAVKTEAEAAEVSKDSEQALMLKIHGDTLTASSPRPTSGGAAPSFAITLARVAKDAPMPAALRRVDPQTFQGKWEQQGRPEFTLSIHAGGVFNETTDGSATPSRGGAWDLSKDGTGLDLLYYGEDASAGAVATWAARLEGAELVLVPTGPSAAEAPRRFVRYTLKPKAQSFFDQYDAKGDPVKIEELFWRTLEGIWIVREPGTRDGEEAWRITDGILYTWELPATDKTIFERSAGWGLRAYKIDASEGILGLRNEGASDSSGEDFDVVAVWAGPDGAVGGFEVANPVRTLEFVRVPAEVLEADDGDYPEDMPVEYSDGEEPWYGDEGPGEGGPYEGEGGE